MSWGLFFAAASTLVFSACTRQGYAYSQSPVCAQQKTRCENYAKQRKLAGKGPEGEGLRLMREDCEASQRACAESMETLQPGPAYPRETPARNWQDLFTH